MFTGIVGGENVGRVDKSSGAEARQLTAEPINPSGGDAIKPVGDGVRTRAEGGETLPDRGT